MTHIIRIEEEQRQLILLALAQLSLERPGWTEALIDTAVRFPGGMEMFESFRAANDDRAENMEPISNGNLR
jgi:hypothetical protein